MRRVLARNYRIEWCQIVGLLCSNWKKMLAAKAPSSCRTVCRSWLHGSCSNCSRRLLLSENRCSAAHPRGKGVSTQAHVFDATVAGQEGRDKTHQSGLHYDTASTMRLYSQVVYTHRSKYLFFCFNLTLCTVLMQQTSHRLSLDGACERKSSGFTWQHVQKEQKQEFLWRLIGLIQAPQHLCYLQSCITPLWRHLLFYSLLLWSAAFRGDQNPWLLHV